MTRVPILHGLGDVAMDTLQLLPWIHVKHPFKEGSGAL